MTNNIFDIQRFGKLIHRKWIHPTNFAWRNLALMAFPILFLLLNFWKGIYTVSLDTRANIFGIIFVISILFSPFMFFMNYNHPKKGITDILLPASILEKYLVMQLTGLIYAPAIILLSYGLMDSLLGLIFPQIMTGYAVVEFFRELDTNWEQILLLFGLYQFILFCNLWFRKNKQIKTLAVLIITNIITAGIAVGIIYLFFRGYETDNMSIDIFNGKISTMMEYYYDPLYLTIQLARFFVDIIIPGGLMVGSYFMLKTKRY